MPWRDKKSHPGSPGAHPISDFLFGWTRAPSGRRIVALALLIAGGLLLAADVFLPRKSYFETEGVPGFYALFGFVSFCAAVLSGWPLGRWLRRAEGYYERPEERSAREAEDG